MPNKIRFCLLCQRYDRKIRSTYTRISTVERETKLIEGYRRRHNGEALNQPILHELVHQKCYNRIVQSVSSKDSNEILPSTEQNQDDTGDEKDEEVEDQASLIQFRSRMPFPPNINKHLFERRQRVCAICNRYGYRAHNKMKQIVSNFMANKLAEGYSYIYKKPYGQSLLDCYIHETCSRKLYSSYRYHKSKTLTNKDSLDNQEQYTRQILYSPHETRSRSSYYKSSTESELHDSTSETTTNLSIERLLSTAFYTPVAIVDPSVELSARSCLFRPCTQRLTQEEIEFYIKRKFILNDTTISRPTSHQSSITQITINDSMVNSNQDIVDNSIQIDEHDRSPDSPLTHLSSSCPMFYEIQKTCTATIAATKIRRRYLKPPPLAKPTNPLIPDHTYINKVTFQKQIPSILEKLYDWLVNELKTLGNPMSMSVVIIKYKELIQEVNNNATTTHERTYRERLKHQLEKYYSNQFTFITPNKREGTYVALNDINHYVRIAIKNAKKEKATEASNVSTNLVQPVPIDYTRQTCETIMNAIRKIRLYIRDSKQVNSVPPLLMRNIVGLISTSEKHFEKISQQCDFYQMIDKDLFEDKNNKQTSKFDKNLRNMSLASDLISARHDNRVSEKHYSLAEEIAKKDFHYSPRQLITLLNRYGHTCSYKSYIRMKTLKRRTSNETEPEIIEELDNIIGNDDKSSDSKMDLIEF